MSSCSVLFRRPRAASVFLATSLAALILFILPTSLRAQSEDRFDVGDGFSFDSNDASDSVEAAVGVCKIPGLAVEARVPHGLLAKLDGRRNVLFLEGTPEEMGRAHGTLLKDHIVAMRDLVYAAGAVASVKEKIDFFTRTDEAVSRTRPFVPNRIYEEIDAIADASGLPKTDAYRLNNFPELFHCSGVAARGRATKDGRLLHVRVLDYLRDIGLQDHSVIIVYMPKEGNAWVSVSYAGFAGSVTAMNAKGLTIGEMGGAGEGKWDGLPMAFLLRRVAEECETVEDAVALMKSTPLTCDYYYVVSDPKGAMTAVQAIAESEEPVLTLGPGEEHPQLPGALDDLVYVSSGARAEALYQRLKENYGVLDVEKLMEIVKRPVSMNSNLHDVIFEPESLELWHAEAGALTPACDEPYFRLCLPEAIEFFNREKERPAE